MKPHPEFINCPFCSAEIEIWSDEVQTKCEKCGKIVKRTNFMSCLDWCKYAKECVGEEKYKEFKKKKKKK